MYPKKQNPLLDSYSIEISAKDVGQFASAASLLRPATEVAVTFLPGEEPAARVSLAAAIRSAGHVPFPHVAARRMASREALNDYLGALVNAGARRLFVVAGDLTQPVGPYGDALAVIESDCLTQYPIERVGIAGYPQGHPDIPDHQLWRALQLKQDALLSQRIPFEIVTQFSFDSGAVLQWLKRLRNAGIHAPVKVGIPGPATVGSLLRYSARCGVGLSTKVVAKYGLSITRLLHVAGPDALLEELHGELQPAVHGDVRIHLYPFGGLQRTVQWAQG